MYGASNTFCQEHKLHMLTLLFHLVNMESSCLRSCFLKGTSVSTACGFNGYPGFCSQLLFLESAAGGRLHLCILFYPETGTKFRLEFNFHPVIL